MAKIPWVELKLIALFCLSLMFLLDFVRPSSTAIEHENGVETKPKDFWSAFMDRKKTKGSVPVPLLKQFNPGARTISSYGAPIPAVPKHSQNFVEEEEEVEESEGELEEEERSTWSDEYSSDEGPVSPVPGHSHHHGISPPSPPSPEPKNRHQSEQKEVKKPVKKVTFEKNLDERKGQWRNQPTPLREGDFWRDNMVVPERFRKAPVEPPITENNVVFESLQRDNSKKTPNLHDKKIIIEPQRKPVKIKNIPESVSADMRTKQIVQDNRQPAAFGKDQQHSEQQFFFPRPAPLILSLDDMPVWNAESMANYFGLSEFQREQQRLNEMRRQQEQQQMNRGKGGKEVIHPPPSVRHENNVPNQRTQNSLLHSAINRFPLDRAEIPPTNSYSSDNNGKIQSKGADKIREDPFQKDVKRPMEKTNSHSSPFPNPYQPMSGTPPEREMRKDPIIDQIKMAVGFPEKSSTFQASPKKSPVQTFFKAAEVSKKTYNESSKNVPHENIQIIKQQGVKETEPFVDPIIRQIQEAVSPKGERVCASVLSEEEQQKLRKDMSKKRANVFGQKRQNPEESKNVKESVTAKGKQQSNVKFRNDRNPESVSAKTKGSSSAAELHHQSKNRPPKSTTINKQSIPNTENRRKGEKQLQKVVPIPSTLKTPLSRDNEIGDSRSPSRNDEEDEDEEEDREMIWADTRDYLSDNDSDYELTPSDGEGEENNDLHHSPPFYAQKMKGENSKVEPKTKDNGAKSIKNVKPLPLSPTTVPSTPELHYNDQQRPSSSSSSYWSMLNPTKLLSDPTLYLPLLPSLPSIWGNWESAGENTSETPERPIKESPTERKNGEFVDRAFVVARFHQLRSVPALAEYFDKGYQLLVRFRIGNSVFPKEGVPLRDYSRRTIKEPKKVVHYFRHSFSDTKILRRNGRATLANKNPPGQFWNAMVDLFLKSYFSTGNKNAGGKGDGKLEEPQLRLEIWVDLNSSRARYYSSYVWSYSPIRCLDLCSQAEHLETFQFVENVKVGLGYAFSITSKHPEKVLDDCKKKKK